MRLAPPLVLLLATGCMLSHPDLAEIASMGPTTFSGYTQTAGQSVRVRAFNQATNQWVTIATAVASSTPDLPANVWGDNPNLYAWSVTTPIATAADPAGRCFLSVSCTPREGTPGTSTARLMFEQGSLGSPLRQVVFDERWASCIGERMAAGQSFNLAAYDCRSPSYPELPLRITEAWTALPPGAPAGALGGTWWLNEPTVVATTGSELRWTSRSTAGTWSSWATVPGSPAGGFALTTEPVIASTWGGTDLVAIALDGRVYRAPTFSGGWLSLRPIAGISGATGRLTAMQTIHTFNSHDTWMAHAVSGGQVQVSVLDGGYDLLRTESFPGTEIVFDRALDTPLPSAGAAILTVVRDSGGLTFRRIPGNAPPQLLGAYDPGPFAELSDPVISNGRAHVALTQATAGGGGQVVDLSFALGQPFAITARVLGSLPAGAPLARPLLRASEGTVVAAWPHPTAGLALARLSPGGSSGGTWVSDALNSFVPLASAPRAIDIGPELELMARGTDGRIRTTRPTRPMLRRLVERELDVFGTSAPTGCGSANDVADPSWRRDLATSYGSTIGELGRYLSRFPDGFTRGLFRELGKRSCAAGGIQPATAGRVCELAKTNVVFSPTTTDYTCTDGVYLGTTGSEYLYARELGRAVARGLGFNNTGTAPASWNATASGIALPALQAGNTIFASGFPATCVTGVGCLGFLAETSYEYRAREEAFAVAVAAYARDATSFRDKVARQRAAVPCSDLLARKYDWIRTHVYGGAEFREASDTSPAVAFCP